MSRDSDEVQSTASQISEYISRELVGKPELLPLKTDTNLLASGVLDSLSLLGLVVFLERQFSIAVNPDEVIPANFNTIDAISAYVRRKKHP
ncbi:MAG TPA: acyl carrier protein [Nitrososphaerales archaeon]|nr:acyl carrier protein [Nitrososphaerales archaeon]